jgi:uncharacterized protein YecT (DUF1311 family)
MQPMQGSGRVVSTAIAAWLLMEICASRAVGETSAEEFGAYRWPSEPSLSTDIQPDLCKKILRTSVSAFASVEADFDIAAAIAKDYPPLATRSAVDDPADGSPSPLSRLDLDLDGTGRVQVVIYRDNSFNSQGDWHYAYVFPTVADFDSVKAQIADSWANPPEEQMPAPTKTQLAAQQYYPSALTDTDEEIQTGDVWAENSLFEANGRYYFAQGRTAFDREAPGSVRIFHLMANGHVEVACQIESATVDAAYEHFQTLPAMGAFLSTIRAIGAGGEDGGTLHSGLRHDRQANSAEVRAAYRPWATSAETQPAYSGDNPYYRYDGRTRAFLEAWSFQEPWSRREYLTLLELTGPAEASYSAYLQSAFGVSADASRLDAVRVVQALIGARIEIPNQFAVAQTQLYFPSTALHQAIMRRDRAAFDSALADPQRPANPLVAVSPKPAHEVLSDALADAIGWPYGLDRLLAAGADPNHGNEFGKTPLMAAAHFDRPDVVRRLLEAGAKANAATTEGAAVWMDAPKRTGRTALMYAAENASPATIKVLLDAGADPGVKDSDGNDMTFYLERNPRFTKAERALGVIGLAKAADQFSGPSYSCGKAQTATEKVICGSQVLRILDAQIARAFLALRSKAGPSLRDEQRLWLQARDRSCVADVDCLAERMSVHLRYLHERLDE